MARKELVAYAVQGQEVLANTLAHSLPGASEPDGITVVAHDGAQMKRVDTGSILARVKVL